MPAANLTFIRRLLPRTVEASSEAPHAQARPPPPRTFGHHALTSVAQHLQRVYHDIVVIEAVLEPSVLFTCKIAAFARKGKLQRVTREIECRVSHGQGTVSPLVHIRPEFPRSQAKCSVPCSNQLSSNAWLSFPHSIVDREHDSNKEIILIIGNFSIRKKRNRTPDTSRPEYSRIPLQKKLWTYKIW